MPRNTKKRNTKYAIAGIGLVGLIFLIYFFAFSPFSPITATPSTVKTASTFTMISYVDGEDVSDFQEITIWVPKSDVTFDDEEDINTLSKFEKEVTSKDADDVSIDLRDYEYAWLEIEDNSLFANNYHKLITGANYDYTYYVYDQSSDVNFIVVVRDTLASVTVANYETSGNLTVIMDVDHDVQTNNHYGDNWDIETEDYNDMTLSEKREVWDEALWQCQAPIYDLAVDEEKEYDKDLEKLTDAFVIRFQFNQSVSTVDGNVAQVNMTINDADQPIELIFSAEYVYAIFTDVISFEGGPYTFDLSIQFTGGSTAGRTILSDVDSGRIVVPRDGESLGTFTKYSDIGA